MGEYSVALEAFGCCDTNRQTEGLARGRRIWLKH